MSSTIYKIYNGKFLSISCTVEIGWSKPFPVRNQDGVTIIPSEEVVERDPSTG